MKIKKLCTYENIQLENCDGSRPRGSWARLQKTFISEHFDITLVPGIGVKLVNKEEGDKANVFLIPFANVPYLVIEEEKENEADGSIVRRRGRPRANKIPEPTNEGITSSTGSGLRIGGSEGDKMEGGNAASTDSDGGAWL